MRTGTGVIFSPISFYKPQNYNKYMAAKESEKYTIDYEFLSKYIRDEPDENREDVKEESKGFQEPLQERQESIGSYRSANDEGNYDLVDSMDDDSSDCETIETSSSMTAARQEFIRSQEDDSLSIDTCSKLNHDWKK